MQGTVPYNLYSNINATSKTDNGKRQNVSNISGNNDNKHKGKSQENLDNNTYYGNGLTMKVAESGISNNSEWILFSPFDEGVDEGVEEGVASSGSHHSGNSILSTRLSAFNQSPVKRTGSFDTSGYVISDFDGSIKSGHISEDKIDYEYEYEDEDENGYEDEDQDDKTNDDSDSLTDDVRSEIESIQQTRLDDLQSKKHVELVNKIDKWKDNVRSMSINIEKPKFDKHELKDNNNSKLDKSKLNRKDQDLRKKEIKAFKKVVGQLCTSLKKEGLVEHEGVFMNNPDLESCVPGYWKRLMLDNLIQHTSEQPISSLSIDIKNKNNHRNFWEPEESGSVQSTSTGWEGGSILGF
ncbi:hypothetical protein C6P42_001036 [Pichia californica]|nr:hypothetical protein C6P42_001036 [[Candida] californica]